MLEKMLAYDEGRKNHVYWDTEGFPTIGVGHLIIHKATKDLELIYAELDKQTGTNERILSDETITRLFQSDVAKVRQTISKIKTLNEVYITLDQVRKTAIENMCFQLGATGVSKFPSMLRALAAKDWISAKKHGLDSLWSKQTPNRANRVLSVIQYGDYRSYGFK